MGGHKRYDHVKPIKFPAGSSIHSRWLLLFFVSRAKPMSPKAKKPATLEVELSSLRFRGKWFS